MTINQFDVIAYPVASGRREKPYLVCIQHRRLDYARTRIFATLVTKARFAEARLNPEFTIEKNIVILDPTDIVTLSLAQIGKPVANLESQREKIITAIDIVLTGI